MSSKNKNRQTIEQPVTEQTTEQVTVVVPEPAAVESNTSEPELPQGTVLTLHPADVKDTYLRYKVAGQSGMIYIPKTMIVGDVPTTITIDVNLVGKTKETKEQRKARIAAQTPQQVAEAARVVADRAAKRAATLAEAASKAASKAAAAVTPVEQMPAE